MDQELNIEVTDQPSSWDLDFLTQRINDEVSGQYGSAHPFVIFIRASDGSILAGCSGSIIFGAIYADQLWVHPKHKKKGLARHLMERIHQYGKSKGCMISTVSTMSFQVPEFYQKLGYKIDFSRRGYRHGASCIFLSKMLE